MKYKRNPSCSIAITARKYRDFYMSCRRLKNGKVFWKTISLKGDIICGQFPTYKMAIEHIDHHFKTGVAK